MATLMQWGAELADGLDAAHRAGAVHLRLSPTNILITDDGVKIVDFGVARLELPPPPDDWAMGFHEDSDPILMAPEHLRGDDVGPRTDLFCLGGVLYEMATGQPPFVRATAGLMYDAILNREPTSPRDINPDLSEEISSIITKALEKDPDRRYQSAAELREDLQDPSRVLVGERAQSVESPSPLARGFSWLRSGFDRVRSVLSLLLRR